MTITAELNLLANDFNELALCEPDLGSRASIKRNAAQIRLAADLVRQGIWEPLAGEAWRDAGQRMLIIRRNTVRKALA